MTPLYARHKRSTLAIATAVAAGALLTAGLTTGASAQPGRTPRPAGSPPRSAVAPRAACSRTRAPTTAATAEQIGLGAKEKLVVKDVVKDADGTVHTRYERTYDGLPVLGGDLVVHTAKSGKAEGRHQGDQGHHQGRLHRRRRSPGHRGQGREEALPPPRRRLRQGRRAGAAQGRSGPPPASPSSPTRPSSPASRRTARPSKLHVITDAATGKKLFEYQAIENGTGKQPCTAARSSLGTKKGRARRTS